MLPDTKVYLVLTADHIKSKHGDSVSICNYRTLHCYFKYSYWY